MFHSGDSVTVWGTYPRCSPCFVGKEGLDDFVAVAKFT